jgi:uncharacterized protein YjdB
MTFSALFFGCDTGGGSGDSSVKVTGVTISGTGVTSGAATIAIDGTLQLIATVAPNNATNKTVTWASSDDAIATVSAAGLVTGVAEGEATVTATAGGIDATVTITVTEPAKVESVIIKNGATEVTGQAINTRANGEIELTAEVSPSNVSNADKVVTWTSADSNIARVNAETGLVTGVAEGTTTITATTAGKKENDEEATASVTINVTTPKLVIFNQTGAGEGSGVGEGLATAGNVTDNMFNENNRLVVTNTSTASGWGTELNKVKGNTFVYLDIPLKAPFSVSARLKISSLHAAAGTDNGIFVGAFTDPTVDTTNADAANPETFIALMGINSATNGRRSVYGTRITTSDVTDNSAVGATQFTESTGQEYLYTVAQNTLDTYTIFVEDDAFNPPRSRNPYPVNRGPNNDQVFPALGEADNAVYLGFLVNGVVAEISNIVITQGSETVYEKPADPTPYPRVETVTITNSTGAEVEVEGLLQMTASVTPTGAYQGVTWSIDPEDAQYATINADTGALQGVDIGTAKVYATSIDNGADGMPVKSEAFSVTVKAKSELPRYRSWNFQELPAGWENNTANTTNTPYIQGMTLLAAMRNGGMSVVNNQVVPEGSDLSIGALKPNGAMANGFAVIESVEGPFGITLKYHANSSSANISRNPSIKIGEEGKSKLDPGTYTVVGAEWKEYWDSVAAINGTPSTGTSDPQTWFYNYEGTDNVDILLLASANPGLIFDVIISEPVPVVDVTGVTLDSTASVAVGKTVTLTPTINPNDATNKAVTWESSDGAIAEVNASGVVSGKAEGTAIITVTTVDGAKMATCTVTVSAPIAVTGVTLDSTTSVAVGKTITLTPTVAPDNATNKAVTWESSDGAIAEVNASGVVSGKAEGTATITVTTADGDKTATCQVTVTAAPPPVEAADKTWSFADDAWNTYFESYGSSDYKETSTVDDLTVIGGTGGVKFTTSNQTVNGTIYSKRLQLQGAGSTTNRAVSFDVAGACAIKVIAHSGNTGRKLRLSDGTDVVESEDVNAGAEYTIDYTGEGATLYLYSSSSGINLYTITIDYP